jgi:hypothetical protein
MASVLELQALRTPTASTNLAARSSISIYRCGKKDNSTLSLAWCGTNLIG